MLVNSFPCFRFAEILNISMRNQHFVTKKYTVARLDEISTMDVKPLYLVYRELNKCISEVIRSISPFALAFEFMVNELKEENPKNYGGNFALSYDPTIDVYVSPRVNVMRSSVPSRIYNVSKMSAEERKEFEDELILRLGLNSK